MFWNLVNPGYGPIALNEGVGGFALDFAAGQVDGITVTRATTAQVVDSDGSLSQVAVNTPRISCDEVLLTDHGLLIEDALSNALGAIDFTTATVGTIGSGGALPTGINRRAVLGLTWQVVAKSATQLRVRASGTASANAQLGLLLNGSTSGGGATLASGGAAAVAAQEWVGSVGFQQITATGVTRPGSMSVIWYNAANSLISEAVANPFPGLAPQTDAPFPAEIRRVAPADTAFALFAIQATVASGATVDYEFIIERPQAEQRGHRSIYQPATSRAADVVTIDNAAEMFGSAPWTLQIDFHAGRQTGTCTLFEASADADNRIELHLDNWLLKCTSEVGGVATEFDVGMVPILTRNRAVISVAADGIAVSLSGKPAVEQSVTTPTGLDTAQLGGGTHGYINGFIRGIRHFAAARSAAQTESLSRAGATFYDDFDRADGYPVSAWTGQAYTQVEPGDTASVVEAQIVSGRLVAEDNSPTNTAAYTGIDAGGVLAMQSAQFVFGAGDDTGKIVLIQNPNGLDDVADITASSAHIVVSDIAEIIQWFAATSITSDMSFLDGIAVSKDGSTIYNAAVGYRADGSTVVVAKTGELTRTAITTTAGARGRYATWEHYWTDGKSQPAFLAIGAE